MAALDPISGTLGTKRASHLLHRLTFGPTKQEVNDFATKTISEALALLFTIPIPPLAPINPSSGQPYVILTGQGDEGDLAQHFRCWFYSQLFHSGTNAIEKLTFFLHTHFTAIGSVINKGSALYYQNQLLRQYALGNFKELAFKICIDNAMLTLLDNRLNENTKPNENYAREFLELYTIGKGKEIGPGNYTTYTEEDVKAAARVLSGWDTDWTYATLDTLTGLPTGKLKLNSNLLPNRHDASIKTFSAAFQNKTISPIEKSGNFATQAAAKDELVQLVDMIFAQEATALNICRKIYRFFVYYKITDTVETEVIAPMAQTLVANNFALKPVLELLLSSQHFFDENDTVVENDTKGAIIKSPLEVTIGMMRFSGVALPDAASNAATFYKELESVLNAMQDQGFDLYEPLDVAGYDAYFQSPAYNRNWISPNFLARRYQFAEYLLKGETKQGDPWSLKIDTVALVKNTAIVTDPSDATKMAQELIDYLLPAAISTERFTFFLNILLDNLSVINWRNEWNAYLNSNDDMAVRTQLDSFFNAVLQSAEYQLN
jgi:uncharacterized protein (DUF1800 family)